MSEDISQNEVHTYLVDDITRNMEADSISIDIHEQYLERLYKQENIQVKHAILFYVAGEKEPVIFVNKTELDIGRADAKGRIVPALDLGLFGGATLGVSRLHAKIVYIEGHYMLQDLYSTNYTWLNGHKLIPYQYSPISDASIIQVGHLAMNIFIIQR